MVHSSIQAQMFYILERIDYSQTWEVIEYGLGYDLGDHMFGPDGTEVRNLIYNSAKHLWASFNGKLSDTGAYIK